MEPTLSSEMSAFKLQTPGKFPKEHRLHSKHGESLKTTNFETVKNYAQMSAEFCKRPEHKFWVIYTRCLNNIRQTDRPIKEVNELKLLLRQLTRNEDDSVYTREKRGVFNFIGGINKILFGTMDNEDANYYTDKISHLENEQ